MRVQINFLDGTNIIRTYAGLISEARWTALDVLLKAGCGLVHEDTFYPYHAIVSVREINDDMLTANVRTTERS